MALLLPKEDEDADMQHQHPWADATAAAGQSAAAVQASQPTDPNKQLSHMLLVAAAAASLPCVAATKCMQLPPQLQQQQQQGGWCGVSFSGLPGLHVQLHQQLLQLLRHAGEQIRVSEIGMCSKRFDVDCHGPCAVMYGISAMPLGHMIVHGKHCRACCCTCLLAGVHAYCFTPSFGR
jgi:hypothetical protein